MIVHQCVSGLNPSYNIIQVRGPWFLTGENILEFIPGDQLRGIFIRNNIVLLHPV